ncbi:S8 family peptidase [Exiguobacterium acetylicum]|uniref:S8 family peptidase n=1 Tax=Exiguobacterium acetylicum TaxID=41170 RepID=UPI000682EE88|nr:S8 family serine peptidase [Exiguobacterium acetylicum]KNH32396.1 hypothetical protein ACS74_14620 [Exiguobacterium acetylicum]
MQSYLIKHKTASNSLIADFVEENGGIVLYSSPVLPIMGIKIADKTNEDLQNQFDLDYIIEEPLGFVQDIEGTIASAQKNTLTIIPGLKFNDLRNGKHNYNGWGTTVAVLDSGVNESWVAEHFDFTGFGSGAVFDHGTKVANIIKAASPGSKILSFKVCQERQVKGTDFLNGLISAVGKAHVLNISIGFDMKCTPDKPCPICEHVNHFAQNNGNLFVVAAGNHGTDNAIQCPGKSQETITVGSIKPYSKELATYSSRGVAGIKKPNILSSGTIYFNQVQDEGTSFSTPIITGVCAALFPSLSHTVPEMKSLLYSATIDLGLPEHYQGFGLLSLEKLMEVLNDDQSTDQSKGQEQQ